MIAFFTSFAIVVLAEMGDKTQLLAMAFACRFRWQTVLAGVFAATAANHLLAVVVGTYLAKIISLSAIKIAASASFILFGVWILKGDKLRGEENKFKFSPFWTVAFAFFLAEMGDKTQFATVALAAKFNSILPVWTGTTMGMIVADAIGIAGGLLMQEKIPEKQIKWFSAVVFIAFGSWGVYSGVR